MSQWESTRAAGWEGQPAATVTGTAAGFAGSRLWIQPSIASVRVKNPGSAVLQLAAPKLVSPISTHV